MIDCRQRWVQWVMESAQYLYMDIALLNGMFNWTMTYKTTSDFYLPYGRFHQVNYRRLIVIDDGLRRRDQRKPETILSN